MSPETIIISLLRPVRWMICAANTCSKLISGNAAASTPKTKWLAPSCRWHTPRLHRTAGYAGKRRPELSHATTARSTEVRTSPIGKPPSVASRRAAKGAFATRGVSPPEAYFAAIGVLATIRRPRRQNPVLVVMDDLFAAAMAFSVVRHHVIKQLIIIYSPRRRAATGCPPGGAPLPQDFSRKRWVILIATFLT